MYIFNPDHDLALANFMSNFTSPASARKLRYDLSMIPVWYAPDGALIIIESELNNRFLEYIKSKLPINTSLVPFSQLGGHSDLMVKPWGWNPAIHRQLAEADVSENLLPSFSYMKLIRDYSSRQHAVKLLAELKDKNSSFCGESFFYTDIDSLLKYVYTSEEDQVLKMPYSGSGKGIVWIKGEITDKQIDWCKRVINKQGGVVIEPVLNKAEDFAMEFEMDNSGIQFIGYSLFQSAPSGAYVGNLLLSDVAIEDRLIRYVELGLLEELRSMLEIKLKAYFPHYRGCLGVDMMICQTSEATYQLQPCVEINMRMNMGIVAHRFYHRYVHPNSSGMYAINFFKQEGQAQAYEYKMQEDNPLKIEDSKIIRGYFALTPVDKNTRYVAHAIIKENHEDKYKFSP